MYLCHATKKYTEPIKIQESLTFDGITSNLPIQRRAYIALIVLATVFSMKDRVYDNIQVACGILHGKLLDSVA